MDEPGDCVVARMATSHQTSAPEVSDLGLVVNSVI
jgi:mannose-6-phosphate isomerase-like protein (cupin superfamily)